MSVFSHLKYREAIQEKLDGFRTRAEGMTQAKLAASIGMQSSYLTHVLKGRADFNQDQLFAICERLRLSEEESSYLGLLLEYERSANEKRRWRLKAEIDRIRSRSMEIQKQIQAEKVAPQRESERVAYYLDPLCQLVHVFLNFSEYAKEPRRLASVLAMSEVHLAEILGKLEAAGFIAAKKSGYEILVRNQHLPKDSPLCHPHQTLMRYKSIDQMQRIPEKDRVSFSVTFSSTPEDKEAIHRAFLDFVKEAERIVKQSRRENVYQINFDLFPWALIPR